MKLISLCEVNLYKHIQFVDITYNLKHLIEISFCFYVGKIILLYAALFVKSHVKRILDIKYKLI